jgi:hypothetical protein
MQIKMPFILSLISIFGDANGDGHDDLLLGDIEDGHLEIFFGQKDGVYSEDPDAEIKTDLFLQYNILDFDNNSKDDIILFNPEGNVFKLILFK